MYKKDRMTGERNASTDALPHDIEEELDAAAAQVVQEAAVHPQTKESAEADVEVIERKQYLHDAIDTIVKNAPDGYTLVTLPDFSKLHTLASELESELDAIDKTHGVRGGMYGTMSERDFDLAIADRKIERFKQLYAEVAADLNIELPNTAHQESLAANDNVTASAPQEAAKAQPAEQVASEKERPVYEKEREAWAEARTASNAAEAEYQAAVKAHYSSLENQSWFAGLGKMKYQFQKLFGISPQLPEAVAALHQKTIDTRQAYKQSGIKLARAKYANEEGRAADVAITKRYERLLAHHLVIEPIKKRNEIQQSLISEKYPNGTPMWRTLAFLKRHRFLRAAGTVGAYTLVGAATGGVGAAVLAGGAKGVGLFAGSVAGVHAGTITRTMLDQFYVQKREEQYEQAEQKAKATFFERDFAEVEADVSAHAREVARAERRSAIISATAAGTAGFAVGGGVASVAEISDGLMAADASESASPQEARTVRVVGENVREASANTTFPETAPIPESRADALAGMEGNGDTYTVKQGDSLWNVLENRYHDHLETLSSERAKDAFIDQLLDKLDASQELKDQLGLQRSDINLIKPGETLNLTVFDRMLPDQASPTPESVPVPESRPEASGEIQQESVADESMTPETRAETMLGDVQVAEIVRLWYGVNANDPDALDHLAELGLDQKSLQGVVNWIFDHGETSTVDESLTLNEYMRQYADQPYGANVEPPPAETPQTNRNIEDVAATESVTEIAARNAIVTRVEGVDGFWDNTFGRNAAGTFARLENVQMREIESVLQDDSKLDAWLKEKHISEHGFEKWMDWIDQEGEQHARVDRSMTFGQYVDTVAKASAPHTVSV